MKTYTEIANAVFEKGNAQLEAIKHCRRSIRSGLTVGAVALIAVGAIIGASRLWLPKRSGEITDVSNTAVAAVQPTDDPMQASSAQGTDEVNGVMQPFGEPITQNEPLPLIRDFPDSSNGKYKCPRPGQHIVTYPLQEAVGAHVDEDVVYYIRFEVMNDALGTMTTTQQQAFYQAEIDRMLAAGVEGVDFGVSTEIDADGTQKVVLFGLMHDPSFLDNFPDSEEYGYFIALYDEVSHYK